MPCWSPPGAQDALQSTRVLNQHGSLHTGLVQPSLNIKQKGRPRDKNKNAEEVRRATTFLEDLKKGSAVQMCLTEDTVGAAAVKNPGGKGTKHAPPTCSKCGERGHKINQCPQLVVRPNSVQPEASASNSTAAPVSSVYEKARVPRWQTGLQQAFSSSLIFSTTPVNTIDVSVLPRCASAKVHLQDFVGNKADVLLPIFEADGIVNEHML